MLLLFSSCNTGFSIDVIHFVLGKGCMVIALAKNLHELRRLMKEDGEVDENKNKNRIIPILLDISVNNEDTRKVFTNLPHINHVINFDGDGFQETLELLGKDYKPIEIPGNDVNALAKEIEALRSRGGIFKFDFSTHRKDEIIKDKRPKVFKKFQALTGSFRRKKLQPMVQDVTPMMLGTSSNSSNHALNERIRNMYISETEKHYRALIEKRDELAKTATENYNSFCRSLDSKNIRHAKLSTLQHKFKKNEISKEEFEMKMQKHEEPKTNFKETEKSKIEIGMAEFEKQMKENT